MKVLFDVNTVLDLLANRADVYEVAVAYDIILSYDFVPCLSATSTADIDYILRSRHYLGSSKQAHETMGALFVLFDILGVTASDCRNAFESDFSDYEDAVLAYLAQREGVDLILTRNKKDFVHSPVPALTPGEFVSAYRSKDMEYAEESPDGRGIE